MRTILRFVCNESVLVIYSLVLVVFIILKPDYIRRFPEFIDWRTIASLTGLTVITTGLKMSGYFDTFARHTIVHISTERRLFLVLSGMTALLSIFLTNDVALFLMIPLTLSYSRIFENDLGKLIIFEAIAANAGSSVSPIGNPQNIFIYRFRDVPIHEFLVKMLPVGLFLMGILFLTIFILTPSRTLKFKSQITDEVKNRDLLVISLILFILFIIAMELNVEPYAVIPLLLVFLFANRKVLFESNWLLLVLFVIFFLDSSMLSREEWIRGILAGFHPLTDGRVFTLSVLTSQVMSNVPAAILISHFTDKWLPLAYGVNIGGNGLVVASLANIIAIRLSGRRDLWLKFHFYSIPILLVSFVLTKFFIIPILK